MSSFLCVFFYLSLDLTHFKSKVFHKLSSPPSHLPLGLLGQLLGNVPTHKYGLQVHPQVLDKQPAFQDFVGVGQVAHPLLDLLSEGRVVPLWRMTISLDLTLKAVGVYNSYHKAE